MEIPECIKNYVRPHALAHTADWADYVYFLPENPTATDWQKARNCTLWLAYDARHTAAAQCILEALFALEMPWYGSVQVACIGGVLGDTLGLTELGEYCLSASITLCFLSGASASREALWRAYEREAAPDVVSVSARISLPTETQKCVQYTSLAYQRHFVSRQTLKHLESMYWESASLAHLREDLTRVEPLLRDAQLSFFDLSALRGATFPQVKGIAPAGLFLEDACRITRYQGMSDCLQLWGILSLPETPNKLEAQGVGQMLWYFLEGWHHRKKEYPIEVASLTHYWVDLKAQGLSLRFFKSSRSGRWWVQLPPRPLEETARQHLLACAYEDYEIACAGDLSMRLWRATHRLLD